MSAKLKEGKIKRLARPKRSIILFLIPFALLFGAIGYVLLTDSQAIVPSCSITGPRDAACWPFSVDSPLNMPIGSGAQYASTSDPATRDVLNDGARVNGTDDGFSHPVYQASDSDPMTWFQDISHDYRSRTIRTPLNATPAWGWYDCGGGVRCGDHHLHIISPDRRYVNENWVAKRQSDTHFTTQRHEVTDLHSTGIGVGGTRAWGGSAIGGLVRVHEMQARYIPHAIALAMGDGQLSTGPVWPATADDDHYDSPGNVKMGMLFAIPPSVDINSLGLNPDALAVAKALQDYGGYVTDYGAATVVYFEPTGGQGTTDPIEQAVESQIDIIKDHLRRVTNISESGWQTWRSSGQGMGGGTPRTAFAPALGSSSSPTPPPPSPTPTPTPAPSPAPSQTNNLLTGKTLTSSHASVDGFGLTNIIDSDPSSRWISQAGATNLTISVDLGASYDLSKVSILWAADTTKNYDIQISSNNTSWSTIASGTTNNSESQLIDHTSFTGSKTGRYLRIIAKDLWNSTYGHSIWEIGVYGSQVTTTPPPSPTPSYRPEDINQDGVVNLLDFSILAANFGKSSGLTNPRADINKDGTVNILDFSLLASKFGS